MPSAFSIAKEPRHLGPCKGFTRCHRHIHKIHFVRLEHLCCCCFKMKKLDAQAAEFCTSSSLLCKKGKWLPYLWDHGFNPAYKRSAHPTKRQGDGQLLLWIFLGKQISVSNKSQIDAALGLVHCSPWSRKVLDLLTPSGLGLFGPKESCFWEARLTDGH